MQAYRARRQPDSRLICSMRPTPASNAEIPSRLSARFYEKDSAISVDAEL